MRTTCALFVILAALLAPISSENEPNVIIVGAGAAGIAAASKLLENNITNMVILEAEGRIGGRINTVEFNGRTVDLGAQFCHVGDNPLVYHMARSYDLLEPIDTSQRIYRSLECAQIDQNFTDELEGIIRTIYSTTPDEIADDVNLGQFVTTEYKKIILKRYKTEPHKLELALDVLGTLEKEILLFGGAYSWFNRSAKADLEKVRIHALFDWKGHGYKAFLDFLLKRQPSLVQKIELNKRVNKIHWSDKVSVECSDGSVYNANHVIVTVSLGVLKDKIDTMFEPKLPLGKIDAIKNIGIRASTKVLLHFPVRQWPPNVFSVGFVWPNVENKSDLTSHSDYLWTLDCYGFIALKQNPNMMEAWFAGPNIPKIELLSDEELFTGMMLVLSTFLGENITKPDAMLRSTWNSNRNFLGTNSYDTVESYKSSSREMLSQALSGSEGQLTLLFAGEATSLTHYGTVDGAVESGFKQAEYIISLYKL